MNLHDCTICPRECHADRFKGGTGYCRTDAGLNIASICIHRGEEPVIGGKDGICNIFFSGCNLRCIYCQNHEISQPCLHDRHFENDLEKALLQISGLLSQGINTVGFVSPSHMVPQMKEIILGLHSLGHKPVIVYNSNGYDKSETLRSLEGLVDVYLPDFKYVSSSPANEFSGASDYPVIAIDSLKEMYRQMGSTLHTDKNGIAERGLLIRHLVLPGHVEESKRVLETIAEELSPGVNVSLMSQYHPMHRAATFPPLDRSLYKAEYDEVVTYMNELGFRNGWLQEIESNDNYLPDFSKEHPFEG